MPNEILLDNDFLVKISTLDLIEEFLALPYVRAGILRHLDTLPYMIKKGALKNYSEEGLRRAMYWMESFQSVEAPSHSFIDSIPDFPGIDPGERLLLASVLEVDESKIFTGDKRCINALGSIPPDMFVSFHHKVICLEAAIRAIIEQGDFEYISGKVRPGLSCDKSLKNVFGSSVIANRPCVEDGLRSYLESLSQSSGGTFLLPWEALLL